MKKVLLTIAVIVIVLGTIIYFLAPSFLYNKAIDKMRKDAGLTIKSVNIPDFKIIYADGGTGDTIIMLHGLGGNKDHWLSFAKLFTSKYRVIIPDLPGHGDSSKPKANEYSMDPKGKNYDIMSQVERLNLFVKELKLTKFHLVGNSVGGNIAGDYAVAYPQMVKTLALFDASGIKSPIKSELTLIMEKGLNPFSIKDVNDYDKLLAFNFVKPPQLPSFIKKYLTRQIVKNASLNEKIFKDTFMFDKVTLESRLDKIKAPTLIVWGDSDKILHVSSVGIFAKGIKNSKSVIIKECGHIPIMEKPEETATIYQEFLKGKN